jgi:single-strand DNA-binding protein
MLIVQVIGNLGGDPEIKESKAGMNYARFSIASNKKIKGEKVTTWLNVTVFDEYKVEFVGKYLNKGDKVFIEGEPAARAYEKDGEARASFDVVLGFGSKIEIMGKPEANTALVKAEKTEGWDDELDDEAPF